MSIAQENAKAANDRRFCYTPLLFLCVFHRFLQFCHTVLVSQLADREAHSQLPARIHIHRDPHCCFSLPVVGISIARKNVNKNVLFYGRHSDPRFFGKT